MMGEQLDGVIFLLTIVVAPAVFMGLIAWAIYSHPNPYFTGFQAGLVFAIGGALSGLIMFWVTQKYGNQETTTKGCM